MLAETFYIGGGPFGLDPALDPYHEGALVWAYKVGKWPALWPGFTIEATRGTPTEVTYVNNLPAKSKLQLLLSMDQTIHWANPLENPGRSLGKNRTVAL